MKPRFSNQRSHALTLVEVLVVIAVLAIVAALLLPAIGTHNYRRPRLTCVNNLKEIGLAYRVWEGDNGDKYPMFVSITNGGSMEMVVTGDVTQTFLVMSNELGTPKILHCPEDAAHFEATSFSELANSNISYFVGVDAIETDPQMLLSGDDNFEIGGAPVKSGLLEISSNTKIAWSAARHKINGNFAIADGSVQEANNSILTNWFLNSGFATNRLAIP